MSLLRSNVPKLSAPIAYPVVDLDFLYPGAVKSTTEYFLRDNFLSINSFVLSAGCCVIVFRKMFRHGLYETFSIAIIGCRGFLISSQSAKVTINPDVLPMFPFSSFNAHAQLHEVDAMIACAWNNLDAVDLAIQSSGNQVDNVCESC